MAPDIAGGDAVWAGPVSLPDDGQRIRWRRRRTAEWHHGVVLYCYLGIEPTVKVVDWADDMMGTVDVFPTLGDTLEPAP